MQITVNSEAEKQLLDRFLEFLNDEGFGVIEDYDHVESIKHKEDSQFSSDEYQFLLNGLYYAKVIVNDRVDPMCIEHHVITGVCVKCETVTDGTIDGEDIPYHDYVEMMSPEAVKSWKCETCWYKSLEDE